MQRFYHKQLFILGGILLFFLLIYLGPILPYFVKTINFSREYIVPTQAIRQEQGVTNVLILGLDNRAQGQQGLTDTLLFASTDPQKNKALLLSLPRDLWVPQIQAKINTAYYYGNLQDGVGLEWAKQFVSEIVGQPIHYVVVISFEGFTKIIDLASGIDVYIERSFVDEQYPISGREADLCEGDPKTSCRYETLHFTQGLTRMDGETALKFARSRHAKGEEGTDFARSQRQQKIVLAVREKVLSTQILLNPKKASQLLQVLEESIDADVPESHIPGLAKLGLAARQAEVVSQILNFEPERPGLLVNPPRSQYNDQYVLVPGTGDWRETHAWIACLLEGKSCPIQNTEP